MAFKMKKPVLQAVSKELKKASKTHANQAKKIDSVISAMPKKTKGGGTKKVCLPAAKVRSMSKSERNKVVRAKRAAAKGGKYKRSSKSNVKGARKKGATLRDWFQKENWVQVGNPSKKCGEK